MASLTWALLTSVPQSTFMTPVTLRVEMPLMYISATLSFSARSLRCPRSRAEG